MEFERHNSKMQHHTTTIVLSNHKSNITSPQLEGNGICSPPPPSPPTERVKNREKHRERKKEKGRKRHNKDKQDEPKEKEKEKEKEREREKERMSRLYRLPKPLLKRVCEFLTFKELFNCAGVCKKMNSKFTRILTSHKMCSAVEKSDVKLLMDPNSFQDGVTFYRTPSFNDPLPPSSFSKLPIDSVRSTYYNCNNNNNGKRNNDKKNVTNAVSYSDAGQVTYHLKQLEHLVIYNTANGNEIVRVANNWILFNRKFLMKIKDQMADSSSANPAEEDRLFIVDVMIVEANLYRQTKSSLFGWGGQAPPIFCQIAMDGLCLRTSLSSDLDPVFNEDCSFTVRKGTSSKLQIDVVEHSKLRRHTKIGQVEISLKELAPQVVHDVRLPVQALEAGLSGSFHILLQKSPAPKREEDTRKVGVLSHLGPVPDSIPLRLEAGDIVLISNSEFYTHIAKLGTLSVWDHVAMVVERKEELHLFESTPDGVFTTPLNRRLKFYLKNSTLGIRRLTMERTPEMKHALKAFVKEVDGRPYKQNWMDLVRAWQGSHTSEDLSSIFCSELVAAAYKRLGLLDNKVSSNNFLPVDFALPNDSKVKLLRGRLEKLRMIYTA